MSFLSILFHAAPSEVLAIRQENTSQNSVTLLWHEPDQPNGVILEYDIKYYEKVMTINSCTPTPPPKNLQFLFKK